MAAKPHLCLTLLGIQTNALGSRCLLLASRQLTGNYCLNLSFGTVNFYVSNMKILWYACRSWLVL